MHTQQDQPSYRPERRFSSLLPQTAAAFLVFLAWACVSPESRGKPVDAQKSEQNQVARAEGNTPAYSRTYKSSRKVTIEKPYWEELEEETPPSEQPTVDSDAQQVVSEPQEEPPKSDQEKTGEKEVVKPGEEPEPATPPSWEDEFAEDMKRIVDRKKGRSELTPDLAKVFPVADEIQLGEGVAARVLAGTPELDNKKLWEYVTFVGLSLAEVSDRNDLAYYFIVLDAADEINAFAAPGGFIFITTGAIKLCQNEAELASILAHEIGHVGLRHGVKMLDLSKYRLMMQDMVQEMDEAFGRSEFFDLERSMDPRYKEVENELSQVADQCFEQILNPFGQDMEFEADEAGLKIMARAGYDVRAALGLLERLREKQGDIPAYEKALHSHPPTSERIEGLKKIVQVVRIANSGATRKERFIKYLQLLQRD